MKTVKTVKTVFLDRDGTLDRERGFVTRPAELEVLPGVPAALRSLADAGFRLVVLTNQSGIARGLYTEADLARVHEALHRGLGSLPAAYLHCPHHPDFAGPYGGDCTCRKPKTGLLHQAGQLFSDIDWQASYLVGDSARDLWCGRDHPLTRILVKTGKPWQEQLTALETERLPPDHVAEDVPAAAAWILARS